jgi:type IV pilus assembly protein PilY1
MKNLKRCGIVLLILALALAGALKAEAANSMSNYISTPPFMSGGGVDPNLLLLIDNSASMYDLAYVDDQGYCYDETYNSISTYVGCFDPASWYDYNLSAQRFELKTAAEASTLCSAATYTNSDVCVTSNATSVSAFTAKGNFLNWAAASKLDVEKEVLTGGKYDTANSRLVMESRGCLDRRFVKKVTLTDSGANTYYLTLGVRPPEESEKSGATDDTSRIEIFEVTSTGFVNDACQSAIDELGAELPNQGQIKQDIEECMTYTNNDKQLADSMSAMNHAIHNCWYASKHGGAWPPGAGPTQSVSTDCENIYAEGVNPEDITPDDRGYVCFGEYDPLIIDDEDRVGYVGRCWSGSGWESAECIETALQEYCAYLEIPEVVDPSDQAAVTGEYWNIPAVLIDSGVIAQLGEPLAVLKAHIAQATAPTGLLQEFVGDIRIGAMVFNEDGSKSECTQPDPHILYNCADVANRDGGRVIINIDQGTTHTTSLVSALNDIKATSWTPVAEAMYNAIGYYTQNTALRLDTNDFTTGTDPVTYWCQGNNVLIITDGASTADQNTTMSTFAATDGNNDGTSDDIADCGALHGGTLLDDLTYYGKHGTALYPPGQEQIDGKDKQKITTHIVVAGTLRSTGADECSPDILLNSAAQNGGTSLYQASEPSALEEKLREAFNAIRDSASGTVVSILSTSGEGEGAVYQAHFKPKYTTETEEVYWTGYIQSLWVDALGNLREDWTAAGNSAPDGVLNLGVDPIVNFFYDEASGKTKFRRRTVTPGDIYGTLATPSEHQITELNPLWEAASNLASRSAFSRSIYTFVDLDGDGEVDGNSALDSNEFISFHVPVTNRAKLTAYLDLANDPATAGEDFSYLGSTEAYRVYNLINYIRGGDAGFLGTTNIRSRTADSKVWKLGDIVHSTPTPVGRPVDHYDLIYSDSTYGDFYTFHKDRETVVYTGANDGMLHAFLAGVFTPGAAISGDGASFTVDTDKYGLLGKGDEIWAYIPQNLLPHLKWLADPGYIEGNHVYYVDLKPRIFDARIYEGAENTDHPLHSLWTTGMNAEQRNKRPHGWCTVLVGGMRFGGGEITVSGNFDNNATTADPSRTFTSSFFALDITDPQKPIVLWERNYPGLGFTISFPAVVKVDEKSIDTATDPDTVNVGERHWYLLFGSGPTTYQGTSTQNSSIYLVDLATGRTDLTTNPGRIFTQLTGPDGSNNGTSLPGPGFMGSPVSVDLTVDYSVNVSYIGEGHESGGSYDGGLYRLQVPVTLGIANGKPILLYTVDPATWTLTHMFDADYAITAAPAAAVGTVDTTYSLWVYFGTGRYLANADKADPSQQFLYGIKDPFYNFKLDNAERNTLLNAEPLDKTSLFSTTNVLVYTDGTVVGTTEANTFADLKIRQDFGSTYGVGWYKELESGERIINKPSLLGGILLAPSFMPNSDICGFGGDSYLHALYFETGTAYFKNVVGLDGDRVLDKVDLGAGLSSSLGIHVGREHGARGFVQQSTGTIYQLDLKPAFSIKSDFLNWREVK